MRRRRVERRAGIKFAIVLLEHTQAPKFPASPLIGDFQGSNGYTQCGRGTRLLARPTPNASSHDHCEVDGIEGNNS